ncbi:MAG: WXG100 family type VII secretion target [Bacilli bacterium]|nr:WXG100 family type VII secretion target [Bacilli bacterium]
MASEKIVITSSNVFSIVSTLRGEFENIKGYISTLDKELENINEAWKGADATKYTEKMKDDYSVILASLVEVLNSFADFLSKVFQEYEKVDNEYKGKTIEV